MENLGSKGHDTGAPITEADALVVAGFTHRDVLREEYVLQGAFWQDYTRYRKLVSRYL
jgi:protein-S-isoprenylcysteine O-methyltransferase Ste14